MVAKWIAHLINFYSRNKITVSLASTLVIFTPSVLANTSSDSFFNDKPDQVAQTLNKASLVPNVSPLKNEISLFGGVNISNLSNGNQVVAINTSVSNTYDTEASTQASGIVGFGYGRIFHLKHDLAVSIGPSLFYTDFDSVNGLEYPASNLGNFDTLNYQYAASAWSLFAASKLVYEKYNWQPFITGGIGPSWNRLSEYQEVPTDPNGMASPNSSVPANNTKVAFAYEVGCGLQRIIHSSEKLNMVYRLSLAYQYMNLGEGSLSPASVSTTGQTIKINTIDTNAILLGLVVTF